MDYIISAILGELTTRSIHFFNSKISKPKALDLEDNLQRALLRTTRKMIYCNIIDPLLVSAGNNIGGLTSRYQ
jgi:hypothetical protein